MAQRASPSPARPQLDGEALVTEGTATAPTNPTVGGTSVSQGRRSGARKSVQFDALQVSTQGTASSPSPKGPRSLSRRQTGASYRNRRFSCFYASGSPFYSLCRDIIQNRIQDDAVLTAGQASLVEVGTLHQEVLRRCLYLSVVSRIDAAQLAREQMEREMGSSSVSNNRGSDRGGDVNTALPPPAQTSAFQNSADALQRSSSSLVSIGETSTYVAGAPSSPFLSSLRVFPLHLDLTQGQILSHLAYLKKVPLLEVDTPSRLTTMKNVSTLVRFQFEYLVEPLLQDIVNYLILSPPPPQADGLTGVASQTSSAPGKKGRATSDAPSVSASLSKAEAIAAGINWARTEEQLQAVVDGTWCREDVGSVEPFSDPADVSSASAAGSPASTNKNNNRKGSRGENGGTSAADTRRAQAQHVKRVSLDRLRRTVGSVTWLRVLRAVIEYSLTTGAEWDLVLRYSLILRLKVMEHYDGRGPALHRSNMKSLHVPSTLDDAAVGDDAATLDWSEAHRVAVDAVVRDAADDFYGYEEEAMHVRRGVASSAVLEALRAQARVEEAERNAAGRPLGRASLSLDDVPRSGDASGSARRASLDRLSSLGEPAQGLLAALLQYAHADGDGTLDGVMEPISDVLAQLAEEARVLDDVSATTPLTRSPALVMTNHKSNGDGGGGATSGSHPSQLAAYQIGGSLAAIHCEATAGASRGTSQPMSPASPLGQQQQQLQNSGGGGVVSVLEPTSPGDLSSPDQTSTSLRGPARDEAVATDTAEYKAYAARATAARTALVDRHHQFAVDMTIGLVVACVQRLLEELRHRPRKGFVSAIRYGSASFPAPPTEAAKNHKNHNNTTASATSSSGRESDDSSRPSPSMSIAEAPNQAGASHKAKAGSTATRNEPFADDAKTPSAPDRSTKKERSKKTNKKKTKASCLSCLS